MSGFDNEYDLTGPLGSDPANEIDSMIKDGSKSATAERIALEHYPLDSSDTGANDKTNDNAQGRHIPGMVSVLLSGTTAEITAFVVANQPPSGTGIGDGAIALDTTQGQLQRFNSSTGQFENLGLQSVIWTAGDGILITPSPDAISIDPADADDMLVGTSLAKVVTPAMSKWSYGNTEYLNTVTNYTAGSAALANNAWTRVPLQTPEVNTITGASIDTGADTFTLPTGVYQLRMQIGTVIQSVSDGFPVSVTGRLVNITDGDTLVTNFPSHHHMQTRSDDYNSSTYLAHRTVEVSLSATTTFKIEVFASLYDSDTIPYFFIGTNVPASILAEGIPVHALEIWKKKPVGA
jgi:hypothetical protein